MSKSGRAWETRNPWYKHYLHGKDRCTNKKHPKFSSYGGRGIKFLLSKEDVKFLYERDSAIKLKRASLDKIDDYKNYTIDNCRFIEFEENNKRPKHKWNKK